MSKKKNSEKLPPLWSVSFVIVIIVSLCSNINGGGTQNGINILINQSGGATALAGTISAVFSFVALVARFMAGNISDTFGRKKVIVVGGIFLAVGNAIPLFGESAMLILIGRIVAAVGFAVTNTAAGAAVADVVPPSRLGEAMGYQGLSNAISLAAGPLLAVSLVQSSGRIGLFGAFTIVGVLMMVLGLVCSFKSKSSDLAAEQARLAAEEAKAKAEAAKDSETPQGNAITRFLLKYIEKEALLVSLINIFYAAALSLFMIFISTYASMYHLNSVSLFFIIACIVMLIIRAFCSKWFDMFPIYILLIPSICMGIVGLLVLMMFHTEASLIVAGVFFGLCNGVTTPGLTAEAVRRSPANRRGAAISTYWIAYDVGMIISNVLWGFTIDYFGFGTTFVCGIVCFALSIIITLIFIRPKKEKAQA